MIRLLLCSQFERIIKYWILSVLLKTCLEDSPTAGRRHQTQLDKPTYKSHKNTQARHYRVISHIRVRIYLKVTIFCGTNI